MDTVWTIGYERLMPESLVAELESAGVRRVIDVRYRPQSRKPGMSKTKLSRVLAAHGITYEHRRALGTPPEIRPLYRRGAVRAGAEAYRAHIISSHGADLAALEAELRSGPPTALLCLEAEPAHCHRRAICDLLRERDAGWRVIDL